MYEKKRKVDITRMLDDGKIIFVDDTDYWCVTSKIIKSVILDSIRMIYLFQIKVISIKCDFNSQDD